jgi:hypothetical protein
MVFEPMYLQILNNDMVRLTLFLSHGSITAVDLDHKFENIWKERDHQQPVEKLFQQIQDCADYAEAGGITISEVQKLSTSYANVFSTGNLHSDCRRWKEINHQYQTWNNFKAHFAIAYHQHKHVQGETAAASEYANAAVAQPVDDDLAEAAIDFFASLATATALSRDIVATLTDANSRL